MICINWHLQAEEELDEEERKQAWLEYEEEKKGKPPMMMMNAQSNLFMQQYNAMINAGQTGIPQNMQSNSELEDVFKIIRNDVGNFESIIKVHLLRNYKIVLKKRT